ncbi:MAG: DnaJ domain-containing protein [Methanomicrobiales archaeon]|nr:DnaJ domain-containing protein [Methanomicrobiales archaeon]
MAETYYEILGVSKAASDKEIKQAYRILARQLHPDICREPGAEDRFKAINEAYRVLSSHEERGRYDAMGHDRYTRSQAGSRDFPGSHAPPEFHGFGDIFDLFFSEKEWGSGRDFRPRSASDILVRMQITLEEALLGCEKVIEVPSATRCASCEGTGSTNGKFRPCPRCGGGGRETREVSGDLGDPHPAPCRECGGKGGVPEAPCSLCGGWGATQTVRRVTVHIPPGIDSGMRIRKGGLGESMDQELPDGDLYVEVTILPHPRFTRQGDDLEITIHISPARAALGSVSDVETIDGRVIRVEIPPGIQQDAAVRVVGEGVKMRARSGDLVARVKIDTPEKATAEERHLYQRLLRIEEGREATKKKGLISRYFAKMKDTGR